MEKVINRVKPAAAGHPENMNTLLAKLLSKEFRSLLTLSSAVREACRITSGSYHTVFREF